MEARLVPLGFRRERVFWPVHEVLVVIAYAVADRPARARLVDALVDVELDAYRFRLVDVYTAASECGYGLTRTRVYSQSHELSTPIAVLRSCT